MNEVWNSSGEITPTERKIWLPVTISYIWGISFNLLKSMTTKLNLKQRRTQNYIKWDEGPLKGEFKFEKLNKENNISNYMYNMYMAVVFLLKWYTCKIPRFNTLYFSSWNSWKKLQKLSFSGPSQSDLLNSELWRLAFTKILALYKVYILTLKFNVIKICRNTTTCLIQFI